MPPRDSKQVAVVLGHVLAVERGVVVGGLFAGAGRSLVAFVVAHELLQCAVRTNAPDEVERFARMALQADVPLLQNVSLHELGDGGDEKQHVGAAKYVDPLPLHHLGHLLARGDSHVAAGAGDPGLAHERSLCLRALVTTRLELAVFHVDEVCREVVAVVRRSC